MIKSMTGFGKGEADSRNGKVKAEVRTVNHKFLDVSTKLPDGLLGFEDKIREMIAKFVKRGKVNLNLVYENHIDSADKIVVDEKLAKTYYKLLTALKKKMDLEGSIRLDQLIALPGVITYEPKGVFPAKIWPFVEKAVKRAFEDLKVSRLREGRALSEDIKKRIRLIKAAMGVIKDRSKVNVKLYRNRLKNSTMEVSKGSAEGFDKTRFEQEVALYAKNSDITEEITRILAHLKSLSESIKKDLEAGKKLDFMAQELNREINTIGSKSTDFKISQKVIQVKSEIEKFREQAKNIE